MEPRPTGSIGVLPLVQMQGVIERPFALSSARPLDIIVNGITVRISNNTAIAGQLQAGAVVKVTGSISGNVFLARQIEAVSSYPAQGGQGEVRFNLRGELEEIRTDGDGELETLLMVGNAITVVPLTVILGEVEAGSTVSAEGIIRDGVLLATLVRLETGLELAEDGTRE